MTKHGVELFERVYFCFYLLESEAHFMSEFFLSGSLVRHEFVQWGVEQTDCHSEAIHSLEDSFEIATLHGEKFSESSTSSFFVGCEDHFTHGFDSVAFEEHVLCAAETDALCAKLAGLSGIVRRIGVGANESLGVFCSEVHDCSEVAADFGFGSGHQIVIDIAGRAVE